MAKKKYVLAIVKDEEQLKEGVDRTLFVFGNDLRVKPCVTKLVNDLKDTVRANKDLACLAAPQLGIKERIFCIKFADGDVRAFINPMISKKEGLHLSREVCASIPDKEFIVPRHDRIIAIYQTPTGKTEENIFEGPVGEVFQQMVNLLDGVLLSDIGLQIDEDFDKATEEERHQIISLYMESLKRREEALNKEIEGDELLKKQRDAQEFMTKVSTGEIKLENVDDEKKEDK